MLNQCHFIGHLGADPETKSMSSGDEVCNLSLAVTEKWKSANGEKKERTEWVRVVIWSQGLVKVAKQYLSKGSKVYISGKMQTRSWEDKGGQKKYSTEIVLQGYDAKLVMLGGKEGSRQEDSAPARQETTCSAPGDGFDDDIPF